MMNQLIKHFSLSLALGLSFAGAYHSVHHDGTSVNQCQCHCQIKPLSDGPALTCHQVTSERGHCQGQSQISLTESQESD